MKLKLLCLFDITETEPEDLATILTWNWREGILGERSIRPVKPIL